MSVEGGSESPPGAPGAAYRDPRMIPAYALADVLSDRTGRDVWVVPHPLESANADSVAADAVGLWRLARQVTPARGGEIPMRRDDLRRNGLDNRPLILVWGAVQPAGEGRTADDNGFNQFDAGIAALRGPKAAYFKSAEDIAGLVRTAGVPSVGILGVNGAVDRVPEPTPPVRREPQHVAMPGMPPTVGSVHPDVIPRVARRGAGRRSGARGPQREGRGPAAAGESRG